MREEMVEYGRFLELEKEISDFAGFGDAGSGVLNATYFVHREALPYLLTFTIDIGVFFAIYQYRKYGSFIHAFISSACMLITLVTSLQILIPSSIPSQQYWQTHTIIGIVITITITVQIACGIIAKALPCMKNNSSSYTIYIIRRIHKTVGLFLIILCKVQTYMALNHAAENHKFWGFMSVDAILCLMFVVRKITMKKMQYRSIP